MSIDSEHLVCKYRLNHEASSPTRCAVGVLIPDELYDENWEGKGATALYSTLRCTGVIDSGVSKNFLSALQRLHDSAAARSYGPDVFVRVLKNRSIDEITKFEDWTLFTTSQIQDIIYHHASNDN